MQNYETSVFDNILNFAVFLNNNNPYFQHTFIKKIFLINPLVEVAVKFLLKTKSTRNSIIFSSFVL
jgi:hypothetical protein